MLRIFTSSAAAAALLSACATPAPPPPMPMPEPAPVAVMQPSLSQAGMDCVVRAGASDMYEIEAGRLALQMSQNASVRSFAQMMIDQHTASSAQMAAALQSINMAPPPPSLMPDQTQRLEMLRTAGTGFDAMYLQDQVAAHQQALALHQACAANAGPPVSAVSAGLIPVVQSHLNQAQALSTNWRGTAGERG